MKSTLAESPRFPAQRSSAQGESAPKARQKCVADGKQVNIPVPALNAMGGRRKLGAAGCWMSRFKRVGVALRQIRGSEPRRDDECPLWREVADTLLPGKASKLQFKVDRTANRHRWAG